VIGVESTADVGSEFWVELPASGPPQVVFDKASKAQLDEPINVAMQDVSIQRTVLYVEDNPANLALVEQLITRRNDLNMLTAIDGYQGIDLARIHRPHIILMDINLPGIGGFDALEILRTDPATSHIPVMALSANAVPRDIEKGLDAGFFRYLTKPIKFTEFIDAIDAALHHAAIKGDANECEEK
ncbi:MAG: response regulator, partial [Burkholderiaceae bacterium]